MVSLMLAKSSCAEKVENGLSAEAMKRTHLCGSEKVYESEPTFPSSTFEWIGSGFDCASSLSLGGEGIGARCAGSNRRRA